MSNISETLLKEKLSEWTSSTKVREALELSSMDEALFKKELNILETKGLIERTGAKKGLKFKYKFSDELKKEFTEETNIPENIKIEPEKKNKKSKVNIEDIQCEIVNLDKHEFTEEVTNVSLNKLFTFITRNASEHSYTLSIKRTTKGICVKTYRDIFMLSEVLYTKENFLLLLKASGVSLD
jgi:hypothetical protein